jgi:hypothetical protein
MHGMLETEDGLVLMGRRRPGDCLVALAHRCHAISSRLRSRSPWVLERQAQPGGEVCELGVHCLGRVLGELDVLVDGVDA